MKIEIKTEKPLWTPYSGDPWWQCVHVRFEGQTWVWQPTYEQLDQIRKALVECELSNATEAAKRDGLTIEVRL